MGGASLLGLVSLTAATDDDVWLPSDQRHLLELFNADTTWGRRAFVAVGGVGLLVATVPIHLLMLLQCSVL